MLSQADLIAISRALQDEHVLSIYVDGTERDPAVRDAWRLKLDQPLKELKRRQSEESHTNRAMFERALRHMNLRLDTFNGAIGAPGLVLFVTPRGVVYEEALPVPMPTTATWEVGASIAPYVRALKEERTVIVLLLGSRKASIFNYREGSIAHDGTVTLHAATRAPEHMGDAPRRGFHGGTRGATGRDDTQRVERAGAARLLNTATERALQLAGKDGWILVGGPPSARARAMSLLGERAPQRVMQLETLDVHSSIATIGEAARAGASALRDAFDAAEIEALISSGGAAATASTGPEATTAALTQGNVRRLFLTPSYVSGHAHDAEGAVRLALHQGAEVEEVSRGVADRLDAVGGIAARLRYVSPMLGRPAAT